MKMEYAKLYYILFTSPKNVLAFLCVPFLLLYSYSSRLVLNHPEVADG